MNKKKKILKKGIAIFIILLMGGLKLAVENNTAAEGVNVVDNSQIVTNQVEPQKKPWLYQAFNSKHISYGRHVFILTQSPQMATVMKQDFINFNFNDPDLYIDPFYLDETSKEIQETIKIVKEWPFKLLITLPESIKKLRFNALDFVLSCEGSLSKEQLIKLSNIYNHMEVYKLSKQTFQECMSKIDACIAQGGWDENSKKELERLQKMSINLLNMNVGVLDFSNRVRAIEYVFQSTSFTKAPINQ